MPIHGYPGNIITANPTEPSQTSASGVWTTEQQLQYQNAGKWPPPYYLISRSLRFNSADSAYLNRTFASVGNRTTWTYSVWLKRSSFGSFQRFLSDSSNNSYLRFGNGDALDWNFWNGTTSYGIATSQVFRDPSAWYHIMVAVDTTQATAANRVKFYVNGSQITAFSSASYPAQNATSNFNNNTAHYISGYSATAEYLSGYLTEVNFIDGQALTPSSFGENNPDTGVWEPIKYTGTYGTNGFYLNFSDNSNTTAATLGKDYSGNGNNWTPNNFSVTAGAGNDSLVDTPTSYGTDTGVGGEVRGNYCTLNPLRTAATLSNGNLDASQAGTSATNSYATIGVSSGKWYWEYQTTSSNPNFLVGFWSGDAANFSSYPTYYWDYGGNSSAPSTAVEKSSGTLSSANTAAASQNDIMGIALDYDGATITFYRNNSVVGTVSGMTINGATLFPVVYHWTSARGETGSANFGQRPFAYTAPSGFKALCTQNLPTPTIGATSTTQAGKYFNVSLYTGNRATNTITGVGFQPDFVWLKSRSVATTNHALFDAVRGVGYNLRSNTTDAETIPSPNNALTAFTSDGFTLGANDSAGAPDINYTIGGTYVGWQWKANGAGSTNTSGTITSTVSANTTSGFSIVTYTGTTVNATVGHGLGQVPALVIVKNRTGSANNWPVWHKSLTGLEYLFLNLTDAKGSNATVWNSTTPTSTVFSVGSASTTNPAQSMVAYCFAEVAGYSAFGSYTGNGSTDGPFVYLGFRPKYLLIRRSDALCGWKIYNTSGLNYNSITTSIEANDSGAEATNATNFNSDWLSNGFKLRTTYADLNTNGGTYIYAAFAESPFKYSLAR